MKNKLFRQQATDRITSPEKVNDYVRIMRSSLYVLLAALLSVVVAVGLWMGQGTVNDFVKLSGVVFPHQGFINISASHDGMVTEVCAHRGQFVREGEKLFRFFREGTFGYVTTSRSGILLSVKGENESFNAFESCASLFPQEEAERQMREVTAFVTFKDLRKLKTGMEVQVSPADLSREEYGYMTGRIIDIGAYPVGREEMVKHFRSEELANAVFPEEAAFEVKILLDEDASRPGQIRWSHKASAQTDICIGTFCHIQVLTRQRPVMELIFKKGK